MKRILEWFDRNEHMLAAWLLTVPVITICAVGVAMLWKMLATL